MKKLVINSCAESANTDRLITAQEFIKEGKKRKTLLGTVKKLI